MKKIFFSFIFLSASLSGQVKAGRTSAKGLANYSDKGGFKEQLTAKIVQMIQEKQRKDMREKKRPSGGIKLTKPNNIKINNRTVGGILENQEEEKMIYQEDYEEYKNEDFQDHKDYEEYKDEDSQEYESEEWESEEEDRFEGYDFYTDFFIEHSKFITEYGESLYQRYCGGIIKEGDMVKKINALLETLKQFSYTITNEDNLMTLAGEFRQFSISDLENNDTPDTFETAQEIAFESLRFGRHLLCEQLSKTLNQYFFHAKKNNSLIESICHLIYSLEFITGDIPQGAIFNTVLSASEEEILKNTTMELIYQSGLCLEGGPSNTLKTLEENILNLFSAQDSSLLPGILLKISSFLDHIYEGPYKNFSNYIYTQDPEGNMEEEKMEE